MMILLILLGLVAVSVTVLLMVCVMRVLVSVSVIQSGEENTVKFLPVLIIVIIMETVLIRNVIVRKDTLVSLYLLFIMKLKHHVIRGVGLSIFLFIIHIL